MYSLENIIAINNNAVRKARAGKDTAPQRDRSSYTGTCETGIIIHSGAFRETRFLQHATARDFVRKWLAIPLRVAKMSVKARKGLTVGQVILDKRDALVDSYF